MDFFKNYYTNFVAQNQGLNDKNIMQALVNSVPMLNYEEYQYRTLRYEASILFHLGFWGESYHAMSLLPPTELGECVRLKQAIENPSCSSFEFNLEVITRCNLRCPMCSQADGKPYEEKGQIMPFATFTSIYDRIKKAAKKLILVGQGETFLHPDIYKILDYSKETPSYIDTNGNVKLDPIKIVNSNIETLVFSVDGIDQRSYSKYRINGNYDKVLENIRSVVAAKRTFGRGPTIVFKFILFKHTEPYYDQVEKLCDSLKVDKIQIVPCLTVPDHAPEIIREFFPVGRMAQASRIKYVDFTNKRVILTEDFDSAHCKAPMTNPNINIKGDVTMCCSSHDKLGNLLTTDMHTIWSSKEYRNARIEALTNRYSNSFCRACSRPQSNLGRLFDGTIMESPKQAPIGDADCIDLNNLKIDGNYMRYLLDNKLFRDIFYFQQSKALDEEAERMLQSVAASGQLPRLETPAAAQRR
jgi:MoaA/NifB/PqqE/SkfB family radical SAM enzyme